MRYITATSFTVALTAFLFQTAVLYPWHKEFSDEITKLTKSVEDLNEQVDRIERKREDVATHVEARALRMMLRNEAKKKH